MLVELIMATPWGFILIPFAIVGAVNSGKRRR